MSFHGYIILRPAAQGGFFENQYPLEACLRSFGKSQSGRYPQCHTFHSCLFSVTHAIKLSGSISRHSFTRSPHFHFCLHCFTVCFPFFLREQKGEAGKLLTTPPALPKWTVYSFVMSPQTVSNLLACRRSRWPCSLQDRFSAGHAFCSISGELSVRSAWLGHQCC